MQVCQVSYSALLDGRSPFSHLIALSLLLCIVTFNPLFRDVVSIKRNSFSVWVDGRIANFNCREMGFSPKSSARLYESVIVINDFSINTLANINNGIEEIFLQFVAAPPIEEPILRLASAPVTTVKA